MLGKCSKMYALLKIRLINQDLLGQDKKRMELGFAVKAWAVLWIKECEKIHDGSKPKRKLMVGWRNSLGGLDC